MKSFGCYTFFSPLQSNASEKTLLDRVDSVDSQDDPFIWNRQNSVRLFPAALALLTSPQCRIPRQISTLLLVPLLGSSSGLNLHFTLSFMHLRGRGINVWHRVCDSRCLSNKSKWNGKNTTLGGQLGSYKGSKKDVCVSVNNVKQGLKRDRHTTL